MAKLSMDFVSRTGGLDEEKVGKINPTEEQLLTLARVAVTAFHRLGSVAPLVEVVKAYFYQRPLASFPDDLQLSFETILIEPGSGEKFKAHYRLGWRDVSDTENTAALLVENIRETVVLRIGANEQVQRALAATLGFATVPPAKQ